MKKIGVLTLPLTSNNYGGILQAFALQTKLKSIEGQHKVELLDRRFNKRFKSLVIMLIYKIVYPKCLTLIEAMNKGFREFVDTHITSSPTFYTTKSLTTYIENQKIKTLITGSDQVWRVKYASSIYKDLFLDVPRVNKFSYAASFGVDFWETEDKTLEVKELLKDFKGVSVREDSAIKICKDKFSVDANQYVDPTMLLTKQDYIDKLNLNIIEGVELLTYVLDKSSEKESFIKNFAKQKKLTITSIGEKHKVNRKNYKNYFGVKHDSVYQWVSSFMSAKFIITDSFHGVVFSILFNVPFIAIGNKERGLSRFNSILSLFNIKNRMITECDEKHFKLYEQKIDFDKVNDVLYAERKRSEDYLNTIVNI